MDARCVEHERVLMSNMSPKPPSTHPTPSLSLKPKIIYQVLRKNIYSPSAWYVPFVLTLGSILLLGLLVSLLVLLAKTIHRRCPRKTEKLKKPP